MFLFLLHLFVFFCFYFTVKYNDMVLPLNQVAKIRANVKFICLLDGDTIWKFEGHPLPINAASAMNLKKHEHWLRLINVNPGNAGTYTCSSEVKDHLIAEADGTLEVTGAFEIVYIYYYR